MDDGPGLIAVAAPAPVVGGGAEEDGKDALPLLRAIDPPPPLGCATAAGSCDAVAGGTAVRIVPIYPDRLGTDLRKASLTLCVCV
jgi:hypothetical protein